MIVKKLSLARLFLVFILTSLAVLSSCSSPTAIKVEAMVDNKITQMPGLQYYVIGTAPFAGTDAAAEYSKPPGIYSLLPNTVTNFDTNLIFTGVSPKGPQKLDGSGLVFTLNFITANFTGNATGKVEVNAFLNSSGTGIQTQLGYALKHVNTGTLVGGEDVTHTYSGSNITRGSYNIQALTVATRGGTPLYGATLDSITDASGDVLYSVGNGNGATQTLPPGGAITFNLWFKTDNVTGKPTGVLYQP